MLRQGWNRSSPGQGSLRGMGSPARRCLLPYGAALGQRTVLMSPALGRGPRLSGELHQGYQDGAWGMCWQKQGLGRYLKAAMVFMQQYLRPVLSCSMGSSHNRTCKAQSGWHLAAASTQQQQTCHRPLGPESPQWPLTNTGTLVLLSTSTAELSAAPGVPSGALGCLCIISLPPSPPVLSFSQGAATWVPCPLTSIFLH